MTMTRLPFHVVQFAGDSVDVYEGMKDYFAHYMSEVRGKNIGVYDKTDSLASKETKMNKALFSEIKKRSGQSLDDSISFEAWATNPMVKWATMQTVNMLIEAVIPDTIIRSIGIFTDIRNGGFGETGTFNVNPNSLMTISQGSNAQRTTFRQKQFKTSKTLVAVNHSITVDVALYKVLSGKESLAEFTRKAILSMDREMTTDAYGALRTLVNNATFPAALKKAGYTQDDLLNLCEITTAYNQGNKATIVGTTTALSKVLPSSAAGYRIVTQSENIGIQLIKDFFEYDILMLPQVATGINYGLALNNSELYIMSTSSDKIVKGFLEGTTLSSSNDFYDNADLTSNATFNKRWIFEGLTNSTMGLMTV